MKALYPSLIIMCLGLGACASQVPVPQAYPVTFQHKMQAAQHWDQLASNVAQRLQEALYPAGAPAQPMVLSVQVPENGTAFDKAFHELLITQLMGRGFGVSRAPGVGLPLACQLRAVNHRDRGLTGRGAALDLGTNISGLTGSAPNSEVVITASVMNGDRYLARVSDIYYISDTNRDQYVASGPVTRALGVVDK